MKNLYLFKLSLAAILIGFSILFTGCSDEDLIIDPDDLDLTEEFFKFKSQDGLENEANNFFATYQDGQLVITVTGVSAGGPWSISISTSAEGVGSYTLDDEDENFFIFTAIGGNNTPFVTSGGHNIALNLTRLDESSILNNGLVQGTFEGELVAKDDPSSLISFVDGSFKIKIGI